MKKISVLKNNDSFAKQTVACHPELDSGSQDGTGNSPLSLKGRGDKAAFNLAEVFHPAEQSKRIAFTLAEVLITLGIIGVVAALTMPALIQNHKRVVASAQLKKLNSTMANWINSAVFELGEPGYWDNWNYMTGETCVNTYFKPFLNTAKVEYGDFPLYIDEKCKQSSKNNSEKVEEEMIKSSEKLRGLKPAEPDNSCLTYYHGDIKFTLNDGAVFYIKQKTISTATSIALDINGDKKPNKLGHDRFLLNFSHWAPPKMICNSSKRYICAMRDPTDSNNFAPRTRNELIAGCKRGGMDIIFGQRYDYCAILLELDNWEFKKDYPLKL